MDVARAAALVTELVDTEGLALVHDQRLPSATAAIAGEPIAGSWWSHQLANVIYGALESLDDRFATCKLVARKLTLVAPRLWPDLAAIGSAGLDWQCDGLSPAELDLLARASSAAGAVPLDQPGLRAAGRRLEERLLVAAHDVHTDAGHHLKVVQSWSHWQHQRAVEGPLPDTGEAMARIERIVHRWQAGRRVLPWPEGPDRLAEEGRPAASTPAASQEAVRGDISQR
jgi:hypothetical protein